MLSFSGCMLFMNVVVDRTFRLNVFKRGNWFLQLGFLKIINQVKIHVVVQEGVAIPSTRFLLPYGGDVCAFHLLCVTVLHIPIAEPFWHASSIYACFSFL